MLPAVDTSEHRYNKAVQETQTGEDGRDRGDGVELRPGVLRYEDTAQDQLRQSLTCQAPCYKDLTFDNKIYRDARIV